MLDELAAVRQWDLELAALLDEARAAAVEEVTVTLPPAAENTAMSASFPASAAAVSCSSRVASVEAQLAYPANSSSIAFTSIFLWLLRVSSLLPGIAPAW